MTLSAMNNIMAASIMTLGTKTLNTMALSIITPNIMVLSKTIFSTTGQSYKTF
jgi:hypothetical protein